MPYVGEGFNISNASSEEIFCFVSKYHGGSDDWYPLTKAAQLWHRTSWDVVVFKNKEDTKRVGFYLNTSGVTTNVVFHSFDKVDITKSEPFVGFDVTNVSGQDIECFITKYTNGSGSDEWYPVNTTSARWVRAGYEAVVFKDKADTKRVGFYLNTKGSATNIVFHSFEKVDIKKVEGPKC